jgi:hypothetical protein
MLKQEKKVKFLKVIQLNLLEDEVASDRLDLTRFFDLVGSS